MELPKSLFKYGKFDNHVKDNLFKGVAYFCPASELDDPYECRTVISSDIIHKKFKLKALKEFEKIVKFLEPYYQKDSKMYKKIVELKSYLIHEKYKNINIFSKIREFYPQEIEKLNKLESFFSALENPCNFFSDALRTLLFFEKMIGVFSLSDKWSNQELWAHYGNYNSGYCIEYDIKKAIDDKIIKNDSLLKVKYKARRENDILDVLVKIFLCILLRMFKIKNDELLLSIAREIVGVKHFDWKQQCEWRFVGKSSTKIILPIKAIYLGARISEINKRKVLKNFENSNIDIYQLKVGFGNNYIKTKI